MGRPDTNALRLLAQHAGPLWLQITVNELLDEVERLNTTPGVSETDNGSCAGPIHGRCLICFEDKPFDVFRTGCGLPPNDVVGVCEDCTAAAVAARDARRGRIVKLIDDDTRSRIRSMAEDPLNHPAGEVSEALLVLLEETRTLSTAADLVTVEDLASLIGHARHLSITGKPQTLGDSPMDQAVHGADVAVAQVVMAYVTMNVAPLREALEQIAKLSQEIPATPVGGFGFPNWGGRVLTLGEIARNALGGGAR